VGINGRQELAARITPTDVRETAATSARSSTGRLGRDADQAAGAGRHASGSALGGPLYRLARRRQSLLGGDGPTIRNGNWQGNDTCWRMALDLNRALLFANRDGTLRTASQPKRYFCIIDGIIGGQGNGPTDPEPVFSNVLIAGGNPRRSTPWRHE
jgi:hypothetical protein